MAPDTLEASPEVDLEEIAGFSNGIEFSFTDGLWEIPALDHPPQGTGSAPRFSREVWQNLEWVVAFQVTAKRWETAASTRSIVVEDRRFLSRNCFYLLGFIEIMKVCQHPRRSRRRHASRWVVLARVADSRLFKGDGREACGIY